VFLSNYPTRNITFDRAEEGKRLHYYEKGDYIPLLASGFWQVHQGVVQLSRCDLNGDEVILGWAVANTAFGVGLVESTHYSAEALCDVALRWFSQSEILNSPQLSRSFLEQLSYRLVKTEELLSLASIRRVEERLWRLLLILQEEMGESVAEGHRLMVRFTHQNLADAIYTTRVTVTRILKDFQLNNLLSFDSKRHIILNNKIEINQLEKRIVKDFGLAYQAK
jgi:CRP-like cAMP-binding protein